VHNALISCSSSSSASTIFYLSQQLSLTMSTQRNAPVGTHRAYAFHPPKAESSQPDTSFILKDVADEVTKFTESTGALSPVKIINVQPIASYSWIEARTPTIAVPGQQIIDIIVGLHVTSLLPISPRFTQSLVHWPPPCPG